MDGLWMGWRERLMRARCLIVRGLLRVDTLDTFLLYCCDLLEKERRKRADVYLLLGEQEVEKTHPSYPTHPNPLQSWR
jgi:hypothetical protein